MSDKFDDQLFNRLEALRGQVDEAKLDALERRLDEADRSLAYHTQQAAEAHSPDLRIANLEIIEKRRGEITAIRASRVAASWTRIRAFLLGLIEGGTNPFRNRVGEEFRGDLVSSWRSATASLGCFLRL